MKRMRVGLAVGALALALAATALSASLAITTASWNAGDRKLALAGTAGCKQTVTLTDAGTGAALGTARAEDSGKWKTHAGEREGGPVQSSRHAGRRVSRAGRERRAGELRRRHH